MDFSVQRDGIQPHIAQATRVCSYDRAGLGWSEPSPHPRTSHVMVDELHTLLQRAGVEGPLVLVGHSFGGANVRLYAHRYPDQVAGMVLIDSAHEQQLEVLPGASEAATATMEQFRSPIPLQDLGMLEHGLVIVEHGTPHVNSEPRDRGSSVAESRRGLNPSFEKLRRPGGDRQTLRLDSKAVIEMAAIHGQAALAGSVGCYEEMASHVPYHDEHVHHS